MKILVSFSGGKDSQACLIQAFKQYGGGNLTAVFCDTGWEHPDTYKHVNDVCLQMGVRLITLKSKYDFVSLAEKVQHVRQWKRNVCTSNRIFNLIRKEELKTTEVRMSKNGVPNLTLLF